MAFSREGFTIDVVGRFVSKTFLNPFLTLPIAGAVSWLIKYPESALSGTNAPIFSSAYKLISYKLTWSLAGLGAALRVNAWLNRWSANNWAPNRSDDWNWDREIVVVTGGSSGVGASIVKKLLERNQRTKIVILDFSPLAWTPPADAENLQYYQCDLSNSEVVKSVCEKIRAEIGHPTVLVNNAGLGRGKPLLDCNYADIMVTIKTNLIAPLLLVNEFLPDMVKNNHGHIMHTGSVTAFFSPPRATEYGATKAAINNFHESLQLELVHCYKAPKVRLSLGVFGFINTPMFHGKGTGAPNFMVPLLHVDTVGEEFVDTLYSGYGRTFYLPGLMRYIAMFRGAPEWLFRSVRESSVEGTKHFKEPRQEIDPETGRLLRTVY